jgi:hypothetical protein
MVMNKKTIKIIVMACLLVLALLFIIRLFSGEDVWVKDSNGVWVKHGYPNDVPDYVQKQDQLINCSHGKYDNLTGLVNSQCLGTCGNYAVDIVHVPRIAEDDKVENQCEAYLNYSVQHFVELNQKGEVIRIV